VIAPSRDLHVAVWVRRKAAVRRYGIIVPDAQLAPVHPRRIVIPGKREVVLGIKPSVVLTAKAGKGTQFDHGLLSCRACSISSWC
jgi:hypothetical protein